MKDNNQEFRRAVNEVLSTIKLKSYQLQVSQTILMFMLMHLRKNEIPMSNCDRQVLDMYDKVMNSDNVEQAEAHFIGLADKFTQSLGLGDFESLKKNYHEFLKDDDTNMGDFYHAE